MARAATPCGQFPCDTKTSLDFDGAQPDRLWIILPKQASGEADRAALTTALLRALDHVATRNHLTRASAPGSFVEYRSGGKRVVSVNFLLARASSEQAPSPPATRTTAPRLAIILDDFGGDSSAAEAVFTLHYPLTLSILPDHSRSAEIAQEAQRRGYQTMLHLPMQSVANETPEPRELRPGMSSDEVDAMLQQMLQAVPGVLGVNNHQGSQATSDLTLMSELMLHLRERNLLYIDSRTTAATVAYDVAREDDVRTAFRNVPFLDDVAEVGAIEKQIELAIIGARNKGEAIAIGHPHPATLKALREVLPRAKQQGVRLVFASELVH